MSAQKFSDVRTPGEVIAEMDALGRPRPRFGSVAELLLSRHEVQVWDAVHPQLRARWDLLCGELEDAEREATAREVRAKKLYGASLRAATALEHSGADQRSLGALVTVRDLPAIETAREWLASRRTWLVLLGPHGVGKTLSAVWAMREAARQGETIALRLAAEVMRLSGFGEGATEIDRLKRVGVFVLDEFGAEHATHWGQGVLGEILSVRHGAFAKTVITCNLSLEEFRERVGPRVVDRIREDGLVIPLSGESLRGT